MFITGPEKYEHILLQEFFVFHLVSSSHDDINRDDVTVILTINTPTKLGANPILLNYSQSTLNSF